jgi:hypothetical protein
MKILLKNFTDSLPAVNELYFFSLTFVTLTPTTLLLLKDFFVCSVKISEGERLKNKFSTPEMKKSRGGEGGGLGVGGRSVFAGNIPANQ